MTPDTRAIAYFKRTGRILPGSQGDVAEWLAENNGECNGERLRFEENARGRFDGRND